MPFIEPAPWGPGWSGGTRPFRTENRYVHLALGSGITYIVLMRSPQDSHPGIRHSQRLNGWLGRPVIASLSEPLLATYLEIIL